MITTLPQGPAAPNEASDAPSVRRWRFSVDDYYRMAECGILPKDARVELIDGEIFLMSPIGSPHAACVNRSSSVFFARFAGRTIVRVQSPIRLGERSEPNPDLALLWPRVDFYKSAHPGSEDIFMLVEIMNGSDAHDRNVKLPLYARSVIREVWLVDLNLERIEIYRQPANGIYTEIRILSRGQRLSPEAFPDLDLAVEDILGPSES
jgi:Uma2 family endonuclease